MNKKNNHLFRLYTFLPNHPFQQTYPHQSLPSLFVCCSFIKSPASTNLPTSITPLDVYYDQPDGTSKNALFRGHADRHNVPGPPPAKLSQIQGRKDQRRRGTVGRRVRRDNYERVWAVCRRPVPSFLPAV